MVWTVPPLPIAALAHTFGQSVAENHHHTHRGCCCCWRRRRPACFDVRVGVGLGDSGAGRIGWQQARRDAHLSVVFPLPLTCIPSPSPPPVQGKPRPRIVVPCPQTAATPVA